MLPVVWVALSFLTLMAIVFLPITTLIRRPTLMQTAAAVENKSGIDHPALSLALELAQQKDIGGSLSLKELMYDRAVEQLESMKRVRFPFVNKYILTAALTLLVVNAGLITLSPNRLINYWQLPLAMISGEQARVAPGSITIPMNSPVTLTLSGAARHYPTARLETWPLDGSHRGRHFLKADSAGNFSFSFDNVRESFVYQFSLSSPLPPETVTVALPPLLRSLQISLTPPRYTRLPPRDLPAGQGNITAYAGTIVNVTLESGALNNAGIIINDRDTVQLDIEGRNATGTFIAERSAEYTFFLTDTLGQSSDSLPRFMISILTDEPPIARILRPGANKVLSTAQVETLWVEGIDDFGISRMELRWRYNDDTPDDRDEIEDLSERGSPPIIRKPVVWNIHELGLYPGDTIFYWLWVRDNRSWRPQTAVSDTFWFRVPSFEEIHKSIAQREEYAQEKLGEVRRRQDNISNAVDRLMRSASGSRELTWDQQRAVDDVRSQIQAQADSLKKAFEALEEGIEALREDGKLDEELFTKMEQIKQSIEELMKEFGDLFRMNNDHQMTMSDMRQAASQLQNMLPELNERLDQTLAFLERIRQEKELADLAVRAENLSNEQAELAASNSSDSELNNRRQLDLLDRIDNFNINVQDFFNERGGEAPSSSEQVQGLSEQMRQMCNASGQRPDQNSKNAMSRELRAMSEQLKSNLAVNMMAKMEEDRQRILRMAHDAISLEEWQGLIRFQALGTADDKGVASAQQALGNAIRLSLMKADSLTMVPAQVMREIVRAYRNASTKSSAVISTLDRTDGTRPMEQSSQALRELANLLLSLVDDDDSDGSSCGGGGGGMMSGLRRASGRQAALNSMMGEMLSTMLGGGRPQGQGRGQQGQGQGQGQGGNQQSGNGGGDMGGGGGEVEREARRQAREMQQAIADELKRLADAYGRDAGESMERRVRELEQEAQRLAQLFENPPPDILDQQDRFLSRMLQSTLSMNRKDEDRDERLGTTAQTIFTNIGSVQSPASFRADSFHLLRKRAFEDNFPEEYRSAIREYFDTLGEMRWGE
jgi:hypothetical protein